MVGRLNACLTYHGSYVQHLVRLGGFGLSEVKQKSEPVDHVASSRAGPLNPSARKPC